MLSLRPICENCARPLPPDATEAMICSFECTFCRPCVETVLSNVCPNCGGGFSPRPVRPATEWRAGENLANHPASTQQKHKPVNVAEHKEFARNIMCIPPHKR